ncbi:MAG: hypothetical protein QOI85_1529 [Chloroflexota bacterium]|jgi:hypothetical protein|nr:hypothetical protein [Chloroflexota bacterium]
MTLLHHGPASLLKQAVERRTLALIERTEYLTFDRRQGELDLRELLGACVSELDHVPPPVLRRAPPFDQIHGLKLVEEPDDVRPVNLECGSERLLSAATPIPEHRQRHKVSRPKAERRQHRLGTQPHPARKVIKQRSRMACLRVDDGR